MFERPTPDEPRLHIEEEKAAWAPQQLVVPIKNTFVNFSEDDMGELLHQANSCPADLMRVPDPPKLTVMLRNLPARTTHFKLHSFIEQEGLPAPAIRLPLDRSSGCSLGYAFLRFEEESVAQAFIHSAQGKQLVIGQ